MAFIVEESLCNLNFHPPINKMIPGTLPAFDNGGRIYFFLVLEALVRLKPMGDKAPGTD